MPASGGSTRDPADRLAWGYRGALAALAVLAILSQVIVQEVLRSEAGPPIVKEVEAQRKLSQGVTLAALAVQAATSPEERTARIEELRVMLDLWASARQEQEARERDAPAAERLARLEPRYQALRRAVREFLAAAALAEGEAVPDSLEPYVSDVVDQEAKFLASADEVVLEAGARVSARLARARWTQTVLLCVTLLALALAGLLVFQPAARLIRHQFARQERLTARAEDARRVAEGMAAALAESEERLQALVENASDAIAVVGPDARVRYVSPSIERVLGYTPAEVAVPDLSRFVHPEDRAGAGALFVACLANPGALRRGEFRARHKDGTWRCMEVVASNAIDNPAVGGIVVNSRDITDRRAAEETLRRIKSDFLANMSHELREPMTALQDATTAALAAGLPAAQREYVDVVSASTQAALGAVDDLLDFAEIEAGRLTLESGVFHLHDLLEETLRSCAVRAQRKGLELVCDVAAGVPDRLAGDARRLRQVLLSLLGNAVKFTERGTVMVRATVDGFPNGEAVLHFTVADTGSGISIERQGTLFDPFAQPAAAEPRPHGGVGLGLAIAAQLVERMGGFIWVESVVGQGSAFHFTARLQVRAEACSWPPEPAEKTRLAGAVADVRAEGHLLVAEDNPVSRMVTVRVLESRGYTVTTVENGLDAVAAAAREPIDALLMDVGMPEMDGLEAARAIRAAERATGAHVPIVGLTAHAQPGEAARCLEAGMDGHVPKPFTGEQLFAAVEAARAAFVAGSDPRGALDAAQAGAREGRRAVAALDEARRQAGAPDPDAPSRA